MTFDEAQKKHEEDVIKDMAEIVKRAQERAALEKEYKRLLPEMKWLKKYIKKNVCPKVNCTNCEGYINWDGRCPLDSKNAKMLRKIYFWATDNN